ncbi:MAG: F0F1 ATP synthase subunit A [Brachymonas sp.]|jgi:F-type H+-transporting ATPase subunit a
MSETAHEVAAGAASDVATQAAAHGPTASEYIQHHLHHWQKDFSFNDVTQTSIIDFSIFNFDSLIYSVVLGVIGCWVLWLATRKSTSGVPSRFQAAVEMLVEMVEDQAKSVIHNEKSIKFVAPLALTVFVWIFLMNAMDMLPVDLLPWLWQHGTGDHHAFMRVVPTADLSTTLGLSSTILLVCFFYSVKIKGLSGWGHELVTAPFGGSKNPFFAVILGVLNFAMQIIEFVAKTVSHGMRLFGNMFAGELVFMLIALMGGVALQMGIGGGIGMGLGHIIAGWVWAVFHILIITLQAFIFMMLTLIYIGQAHDAH